MHINTHLHTSLKKYAYRGEIYAPDREKFMHPHVTGEKSMHSSPRKEERKTNTVDTSKTTETGTETTELTSDFKESNMVAERNDFIQQVYGELNLVPLKLLKLLISCIDTNNPRSGRVVYLKKREIFDFLQAKGKGQYYTIQKNIDELIRAVTLIDACGNTTKVALLVKYKWNPYSDYVAFYFDEDVWPYLTNLKKENPYLQYNIMQIQPFKSKFTVILYELLLSYARLYQTKVITIDVERLRTSTGTTDKYPVFKDFEKNVLNTAKLEINNDPFLEFLFTYEKLKGGGKNKIIEFHLRKRTSIEDTLDYTAYPSKLEDPI